MSRSNPKKQKPRQTRATAQIVVEGYTEQAFCKYLKSLYARNCGVSVDIHNARGGAPTDVVRSALRRSGFDKTFIVYDTDVELPQNWQKKSGAAKQIAVTSTPCIEALFLELLGRKVPSNTSECKKSFSEFLNDSEKLESKFYSKIFPKDLLDHSTHPTIILLLTAFDK